MLAGLIVAGAVALLAGLLASGKGTSRPSVIARAGVALGRAHPSPPTTTTTATNPPVTPLADESAESPQVRGLIALGKPIYCAPNKGDEVALTFDDGPGTYTKLAIAKLRKHDVKATFFVVGRNIPLLPRAIREERGAWGAARARPPGAAAVRRSSARSLRATRSRSALRRPSQGSAVDRDPFPPRSGCR